MKNWIALMAIASLLTACAMTPEEQGAAGGGAVGAMLGGLAGGVIGANTSSGKGKGAAVGAIAGGMLGALIGQRMNRQKEQLEQVQGVETVQYDEQKQQIDATLRILFDVDKSDVKPMEAVKLDDLANVFRQYPENVVVLEGHTDSDGSEQYNQHLSAARALSIAQYLRGKQLDIASMQAVGYGETRPVADNQTAAGKAQNRRVEIKISVDPNRVPQTQPAAAPATPR